jgi:iron-sulfur cluster assembly accessory protein
MAVTVTERASTEIKNLLEENKTTSAALRVWVEGGGCSGLRYGMQIDDAEPEETDQVFESNGLKVFVDALSLQHMDGSSIDYVEDVLGGGFKIDNPNAAATCGCGSSFNGEDGAEGGGCGGCGSH